jgi:hypothetical protein
MAETLSTKREFKQILKTMTSRLILLSGIWALWSFFYSCVSLSPLRSMS